jgi:hypothetical protein
MKFTPGKRLGKGEPGPVNLSLPPRRHSRSLLLAYNSSCIHRASIFGCSDLAGTTVISRGNEKDEVEDG